MISIINMTLEEEFQTMQWFNNMSSIHKLYFASVLVFTLLTSILLVFIPTVFNWRVPTSGINLLLAAFICSLWVIYKDSQTN